MTTARGRTAARLAAAAAVLALLPQAAPATAADTLGGTAASIDHAAVREGGVRLLVSAPTSGEVDLGGVAVEVGGKAARSTATAATGNAAVRRTTVLAIDTSNSMRGERIAAAQQAATLFLENAPGDVLVGLVTFDDDVQVLVKPSRDRAALRRAVAGLTLTRSTALYDGILGALEASGTGARSLLVLSDGKDTTDTPLSTVLKAIEEEDVTVDVVSLQLAETDSQPLQLVAQVGGGRVMDAAPASLGVAFADAADALGRQLVVDVTLPPGTEPQTDVTVSVPVGGRTVSTSAYLEVGTPVATAAPSRAPAAVGPAPAAGPRIDLPPAAVIGGVGAIGAGLLGIVAALFLVRPGASQDERLREQLEAYSVHGPPRAAAPGVAEHGLGAQARQVAEKALAGNEGLEARIALRLDAAGMSLKPAEWLLVHAGVSLLAGVLGMLLSGGNIVLALVFLGIGAAGGWLFLGLKKARRLKAFSSSLADTLQLMSGSLSAGLSLAQSVDTIVKEGVDPIAGEFRRVIVESRLGVPLEDSMEAVAARMESKDFAWVVMAIKIQRQVGGNLAELLLQVAATLREREYLRRQVRALSAEGRLSAYILGGLPPVFLLYVTLTKPDYTGVLYTTTLGWLMLGFMAVMLAVGFVWMLKVAKVDL